MSNPLSTLRFSERVTATTVLAFAALIGILLGVALDRTVLLPHMFHRMHERYHTPFGARPFLGHGSRNGLATPDMLRAREHLARELNLTNTQQVQIDSIMTRRMAALRQMRQETEGRVSTMLDETRREIDSVLTPAQRQQFQTIRARHERGGPFHEELHNP